MRKIFAFLLPALLSISIKAQVTPYTGGEGSGSSKNQSAFTVCTQFFGDSADGFSSNTTQPIPCPMFFGGSEDGAAQNFSALTICPSFFGGIGDGYASDSIGCLTVLPIRLVDFYGNKEETRNILHWKVDFAPQVQLFELERSGNGNSFTTIGKVHGSTNANHLFTYIDQAPLPGVNFYRLKIRERNGDISYSPVVVLRNFSTMQFSVYPNPAKNELMVYCFVQEEQTTTVRLTDINGRRVFQQNIHLKKGVNYFRLNSSRIKIGIYLLQLLQQQAKIIISK